MNDDLLNYQPPADLLKDRVILVTGAASGIGRSAGLAFARHGATVVLLDRNERGLNQVYDEIEQQTGTEPVLVTLDLASCQLDAAEALAQRIGEAYGRLDGLLHNAAELGVLAPLEHYDPQLWQRILQVNLTAPFIITRSCLPWLKRSDNASVLFTSADVGRSGRAYWGAYGVSCFGLEGLMQTLAQELESAAPVRVNSLDPGPVNTDLRRRAFPGDSVASLLEPESLMPAYLYLMGRDSQHLNGQALELG